VHGGCRPPAGALRPCADHDAELSSRRPRSARPRSAEAARLALAAPSARRAPRV